MSSARYTQGYGRDYVQALQRRSAATHAQFIDPHLRSGMSLIDCGCGPGSITVDLAQLVAPGRVVGIDIEPSQIDLARRIAEERGVGNADFRIGDIRRLPVEDGEFDIGFMHNVLLHVADPVRALQELRRAIRPGGAIAICHSAGGKLGGTICHPPHPGLEKDIELYAQLKDLNGCASNIGPRQRELLLDAGFERVEASVHSFTEGTEVAISRYARMRARRVSPESDLGRKYVEHELATEEELRELSRQWVRWGQTPGAFLTVPCVAAIGWNGPDQPFDGGEGRTVRPPSTIPVDDDLTLHPLFEVPIADFVQCIAENADHLRPYQSHWNTRAQEAEAFLSTCRQTWGNSGELIYAIREEGTFVGTVSLARLDARNRAAELAYWLSHSGQGRGIATRAASSMVRIAFEHFDANQVMIESFAENRRSRAIAERLGFRLDGVTRQWRFSIDGQLSDKVTYSLLRREWAENLSSD